MNCLHPLVLSIKSRIFLFRNGFLYFFFLLYGKQEGFPWLPSEGPTETFTIIPNKKNSDYFSLISLQSLSLILDILLVKSLIHLKFLGW